MYRFTDCRQTQFRLYMWISWIKYVVIVHFGKVPRTVITIFLDLLNGHSVKVQFSNIIKVQIILSRRESSADASEAFA